MTPRAEIQFCTQCRWLLRAAWMAQELLTTFETELGEVALVPGTGGVFEVRLDGELIFSRRQEGRFPESKELKQLTSGRIAPDRSGTATASEVRPRPPSVPAGFSGNRCRAPDRSAGGAARTGVRSA